MPNLHKSLQNGSCTAQRTQLGKLLKMLGLQPSMPDKSHRMEKENADITVCQTRAQPKGPMAIQETTNP